MSLLCDNCSASLVVFRLDFSDHLIDEFNMVSTLSSLLNLCNFKNRLKSDAIQLEQHLNTFNDRQRVHTLLL